MRAVCVGLLGLGLLVAPAYAEAVKAESTPISETVTISKSADSAVEYEMPLAPGIPAAQIDLRDSNALKYVDMGALLFAASLGGILLLDDDDDATSSTSTE